MGLRPGLRRDFDKFRNDETPRILNNGGFLSSTVLRANDRVAFSAIAAAHHLGVEIGHGADCDLRIAGHDDHPLSRYACPPITTVAQNYNEIGRLAMQLLLRKIGEETEAKTSFPGSERILLNAEIMLRNSS